MKIVSSGNIQSCIYQKAHKPQHVSENIANISVYLNNMLYHLIKVLCGCWNQRAPTHPIDTIFAAVFPRYCQKMQFSVLECRYSLTFCCSIRCQSKMCLDVLFSMYLEWTWKKHNYYLINWACLKCFVRYLLINCCFYYLLFVWLHFLVLENNFLFFIL